MGIQAGPRGENSLGIKFTNADLQSGDPYRSWLRRQVTGITPYVTGSSADDPQLDEIRRLGT